LEQERLNGKSRVPRLDRFLLLYELGRGGMAAVWKAWDTKLNRAVALKMLKVDSELERALLMREARMAGQLAHPNIVPIHEVIDDGGTPCIAMGLVEGMRLDEAARKMGLREIVESVRDAARAVQYAHTKQVIHRDLKPENMMMDREGRVYVMDFGLAKALRPGSSLSCSSAVSGTPAYMSPEQAMGNRDQIGPRSDVFGLGATLYALLAGQAPFSGASVGEVLLAAIQKDPTPLAKLRRDLPREIPIVVGKAMEREPQRRYATAEALAEDLDRFLRGDAVVARPSGFVRKAAKLLRKRWVGVAAALVVLGALGFVVDGIVREHLAARRKAKAQPKYDLGLAAYERGERMYYQTAVPLDAQLEEFREAVRRFDEAIAIDPKFAEAFYYRGLARKNNGEVSAALGDLSEAIRIQPAFRRAHLARGLIRIEGATAYLGTRRFDFGETSKSTYAVRRESIDPAARASFEEARRDIEIALRLAEIEQDRLFAEALLAHASQDSLGARERLNRLLARYPADFVAFRLRAQVLETLGEVAEALRDYDRCLELRRGDLDVLRVRGLLRLVCGDVSGAEQDSEEYGRRVPRSLEGHHLRAFVLTRRADYRKALSLWDHLILSRPKDTNYRLGRVNTLLLMGRGAEALGELEATEDLCGTSEWLRAKRANVLHALGRIGEAVDVWTRMIRDRGPSGSILFRRGRGYWMLRRYEDAARDFRACLEIAPGDANAHWHLADSLCSLGRHAEAVEAFAAGERVCTADPEFAIGAALCCMDLRRLDQALTLIDRAIAIDSRSAKARHNRAFLYHELGLFPEARRDSDEALRLRPTFAATWSSRAFGWQREGRPAEAAEDYLAAAMLPPHPSSNFQDALSLLIRVRHWQRALVAADAAVSYHPYRASFLADRGLILFHLRRFGEALAATDLALSAGADRETRFNRAIILTELKRSDEAISEYRRILREQESYYRAYPNLVVLLMRHGKRDEAAAVSRKGLRFDPQNRDYYLRVLRVCGER